MGYGQAISKPKGGGLDRLVVHLVETPFFAATSLETLLEDALVQLETDDSICANLTDALGADGLLEPSQDNIDKWIEELEAKDVI